MKEQNTNETAGANQNRVITMDEAVNRVEKLGFRFSNWLSDGSAVCIRSRKGMRHYAQIDIESPDLISGQSFDEFKSWANRVRS